MTDQYGFHNLLFRCEKNEEIKWLHKYKLCYPQQTPPDPDLIEEGVQRGE